MAATVNRPRGGKFACLEMNLKVCLKLQRVSGYCGQIRSTFKLLFSRCGLSMIMSVGVYYSMADALLVAIGYKFDDMRP